MGAESYMSQLCDDKELLEEFLAEATDLLDTIDDDLISLEKDPCNLETLNRVFRAIHTVKGNASFLEFELLVVITHKTEDVLNKLRKVEIVLTPEIMDVIMEAIGLVKILLHDIKCDKILDRPIDGTIKLLNDIIIQQIVSFPSTDHIDNPAEILVLHNSNDKIDIINPTDFDIAKESTECHNILSNNISNKIDLTQVTSPEEYADKSTVRVDVKRIDDLINHVGELVLERNRMIQLHCEYQNGMDNVLFSEEFAKLTKRTNFVTSELQAQALKMRLIPVGNVFKKFPRIVRNLSRDLGKQVDLQIFGEETELDRSVVDEISDPLTHLIRNALDHGLESPKGRIACGKHPTGSVILSACHEGNRIIISIKDDGRGIDSEKVAAKALEKKLISEERLSETSPQEIFDLIFLPGFSTKDTASDLSGRGVGMDVVRTNIKKLNGIIEIKSEKGKGSEFILKLPLTLAIIKSLLVDVNGETYSIPLSAIIETLRVKKEAFHTIGGRNILPLRNYSLPLLDLAQAFGVTKEIKDREYCYVVVVGVAEKRLGLLVTRLLGQQEVAIKTLGTYLADVPGIAGSTIMGDGRVALIVDPAKLIEISDTMESLRNQPSMK
jgi:two-component system chemotaxis sensor kinase CheA